VRFKVSTPERGFAKKSERTAYNLQALADMGVT
jgi:hypothetical protein